MAKTYTGADIEIGFDMNRCIHARSCYLKLPQVFDPDRRPWVDPDAAPAEEIAAMVRTCPSGALSYRRRDSGTEEKPPGRNMARLRENGPLELHGALEVDGTPAFRATLCRCGKSGNMPFCDTSHIEAGFAATGEPSPETTDRLPETSGGPLSVTPIENGPLGLRGAVEIISGTGHRIARAEKAFLCRCGQSSNKPFCDGSHKAAGFTAPGPTGA